MQNSSASSKKTKTEFFRLSVTLFLIAGIMALIVAFVNNLTAPTIAKMNEQNTQKALLAVMPDAEGFETVEVDALPDTVAGVWRAKNGVGYCVKVCPKGYGGEIETIVGVDNDGKLVGTEIVTMSETSGIGTKIQDKDFKDQFKGIDSVDSVHTISGATRSSKAFVNGVDTALDVVAGLIGGDKYE